MSILDYAPDLGADYLALADEVLERLGGFDEARERLQRVGELVGDRLLVVGQGVVPAARLVIPD